MVAATEDSVSSSVFENAATRSWLPQHVSGNNGMASLLERREFDVSCVRLL